MDDTIAQELAKCVARMYRVALRIIGSEEEAHDVAQEACVKALRRADRFDGRAALATWLHRITVNCAHDHLRKTRRLEHTRSNCDPETLGMVAMVEAGPDEHAERNDAYHRLMNLIAALPDDCRSAFMLTQLDGYTYDEAAAIEDRSRGTVASRVYRARQILMEQMNHHRVGEGS